MKREIIFGMLWGLALCLLFVAIFYSVTNSAEVMDDQPIVGDIEISISGDSVQVDIDKGDIVKSITVSSDSITKTPSGIAIQNELIIENGKIIVDGVELSEEELRRLKINQDQETEITAGDRDKSHRQYRRKRLATAYGDRGDDVVGFRDITIDSAASIRGDVVSITGDVVISGEVLGDVVSVFGDIYLEDGADIRGNASAPFGKVHKAPSARLRGETVTRADIRKKRHSSTDELFLRFNRVEGLALGMNLTYSDSKNRYPSMEAGGGYAFSLKRWLYKIDVNHRIGKVAGPYFDIAMFQAAETSDRWLLDEDGNTIKALFFGEDAYDFYWSRGFSGEAGLFYGERFKAGFLLNASRISNLEKNTVDGIFGGRDFRRNWSTLLPDSSDILASAGDLKEYGMSLTYDSRDNKESPEKGLYSNLKLLTASDGDSADFDYSLAHFEVKGYLPAGRNQTVMMRLRAGHSDDRLPLFRRFFLGGIGSLRGYDYKEFEGNRYALFNIDYVWFILKSDIGAAVFFDAGKAAFGEDAFDSGDIKTDVGIGFLVSDAIRIDLAQRLDDLDKSPVVSLRFDTVF